MFELSKVRYKDIIAIDQLSIKEGKTTCLVGESGSGKTTLLKLLNHLVDFKEGTITYQGNDLKILDAVLLRRKVILLPQTPVIFPGTIKENLLIGLMFAKKELASDQRLLAELEKVGLHHKKLDEDASQLSGGEQQRLALIRVILMEPEVLLLDEPTSALDDETVERITAYIKEYLNSGEKTMVLVTHSKPFARAMGNVIVTINNGRITATEEVA